MAHPPPGSPASLPPRTSKARPSDSCSASDWSFYSPLAVLIFVGCYVAFNYYRVSYKVIGGAAALYGFLYFGFVVVFGSLAEMIAGYHAPFGRLLAGLKGGDLGALVADNFWFWVTSQLPLSVAIGLGLGAVVTTYKWLRRPVWEDKERIPGPIHRWRRKKVIAQIASDTNGPAEGRTLGVDKFGARITQSVEEAAAHGLIAGGSGAGKTTTMLIGVRDAIRRGEPVVVVDLKGAADLPKQIAGWCDRYDRRFLHWSITDVNAPYTGPADGPAFYDPIGRGDPSRKKDLLIGAAKLENEYYKSVVQSYLQTAFQVAALNPDESVDAFTDLLALLDMDSLKQRALGVFLQADKNAEGQQLVSTQGTKVDWVSNVSLLSDPHTQNVLRATGRMLGKTEESERSAIRGMALRMQTLRGSIAGDWLQRDHAHGRDIDLRKVADNGWVVVFSLDSSNYEETSAQIGGLIVQDLKTLSADLRNNPAPTPMNIYLDEFSAMGSENITGLLSKARDARMPTMLSTQALGDLRRVDPAFLDQVLGIINYFVLHRTNKEEDAEVFAGLTGKKWTTRVQTSVEMSSGLPGGIGTGASTGRGNIEQVEDYVVSASAFQALDVGQMVYIAKSPKARVISPVTVVREDPALVAQRVATGTHTFRPAVPAPTPVLDGPFDVSDPIEELPSPWPVMVADPAGAATQSTSAAPSSGRVPISDLFAKGDPVAPAPLTSAAPGMVPVAPSPVTPPGPVVPVAPATRDSDGYDVQFPATSPDWSDDVAELDFSKPVRSPAADVDITPAPGAPPRAPDPATGFTAWEDLGTEMPMLPTIVLPGMDTTPTPALTTVPVLPAAYPGAYPGAHPSQRCRPVEQPAPDAAHACPVHRAC